MPYIIRNKELIEVVMKDDKFVDSDGNKYSGKIYMSYEDVCKDQFIVIPFITGRAKEILEEVKTLVAHLTRYIGSYVYNCGAGSINKVLISRFEIRIDVNKRIAFSNLENFKKFLYENPHISDAEITYSLFDTDGRVIWGSIFKTKEELLEKINNL
jgi:hypothetical protein